MKILSTHFTHRLLPMLFAGLAAVGLNAQTLSTTTSGYPDSSGYPKLMELAASQQTVLNAEKAQAEFPGNPQQMAMVMPIVPLVLNGKVAILRDNLPWGMWVTDNYLNAHSIPFEVHGSAEFGTLDLTQFRLVIVQSVQPSAFYTAFNANLSRFASFLAAGGNLLYSFCENAYGGGVTPLQIPGASASIVKSYQPSNTINPDYLSHPVLLGVPSPFLGNFASHDYFSSWPGTARVLCVVTGTSFPTLIEYKVGSGTVLATGITLEWSNSYGLGGAPILPQSIDYLYYMLRFDRYFLDDNGRTRMWLNSTTGAWKMEVLVGFYQGIYEGQVTPTSHNGILVLPPTAPGTQAVWGYYDPASLRAAFTLRTAHGGMAFLFDTNTTGQLP